MHEELAGLNLKEDKQATSWRWTQGRDPGRKLARQARAKSSSDIREYCSYLLALELDLVLVLDCPGGQEEGDSSNPISIGRWENQPSGRGLDTLLKKQRDLDPLV